MCAQPACGQTGFTEPIPLEQDSKILAQTKTYRIIQNEAENAGRLTPVKDGNEVVEDFCALNCVKIFEDCDRFI